MMESLLRRLTYQGLKVSLISVDNTSSYINIDTDKKLPDLWLMKAAPVLTPQLRQIKEYGGVSCDDVNSFFECGGKLFEEMSDDEWAVKFKMVEIN